VLADVLTKGMHALGLSFLQFFDLLVTQALGGVPDMGWGRSPETRDGSHASDGGGAAEL
jgi:hypothetical protein